MRLARLPAGRPEAKRPLGRCLEPSRADGFYCLGREVAMQWKPFFITAWNAGGRDSARCHWLALRRGWLAWRAARIMKSYVVPGIPPLAWGQWLLLLAGGVLVFLTLLGGAAFLAPAGGAPR